MAIFNSYVKLPEGQCLLPPLAKTMVLQCFLDNTEQKHWYLRNFRHDFPCKSHKTHVNYSVLGLILGFVTGGGGGPQMNSNRLNTVIR